MSALATVRRFARARGRATLIGAVAALVFWTSIIPSSSAAPPDAAPWHRRRRVDAEVNQRAMSLVQLEDWPAEPATPSAIDPARFAKAYHEICGWMPPGRARRWGDWMLAYAKEAGEDPFLLAALTFRLGRCRSDAEEMGGLGLTLIVREMYAEQLREGFLRYWVKSGKRWVENKLRADRFPFAGPRLKRPEENLYFATLLLSMWRRQHESVDHAFEQVPHRHYVSHFIWGDRVRSDRSEDRILTDRRRLLQYYAAARPKASVAYRGYHLASPLDGVPRVISGYLGDDRDKGERAHRGIDVESVLGEPVRAVADGRVNFVGVDWPGQRSNEIMEPEKIMDVPRKSLGRGGRYVCVLHTGGAEGWLRSCYMHLEGISVRQGQTVRQGEVVGTVGRTGMQSSAPHLHLELHGPDGLLDPSMILRGPLIGRRPEPERPKRLARLSRR